MPLSYCYILQTRLQQIIFVTTPIGTRKKTPQKLPTVSIPPPQSNVEHDKLLFLRKAYCDQH